MTDLARGSSQARDSKSLESRVVESSGKGIDAYIFL